MARPIPELAPVTSAFWPASTLKIGRAGAVDRTLSASFIGSPLLPARRRWGITALQITHGGQRCSETGIRLRPSRFCLTFAEFIATLEHDPEKWIPVFGKDH